MAAHGRRSSGGRLPRSRSASPVSGSRVRPYPRRLRRGCAGARRRRAVGRREETGVVVHAIRAGDWLLPRSMTRPCHRPRGPPAGPALDDARLDALTRPEPNVLELLARCEPQRGPTSSPSTSAPISTRSIIRSQHPRISTTLSRRSSCLAAASPRARPTFATRPLSRRRSTPVWRSLVGSTSWSRTPGSRCTTQPTQCLRRAGAT